MIPDYLTVANPVDNGAQFLVTTPVEDRRRVFDLDRRRPRVDVIVIGLTGALGRLTDRFAEDIVAFIDEIAEAHRGHVELVQDRRAGFHDARRRRCAPCSAPSATASRPCAPSPATRRRRPSLPGPQDDVDPAAQAEAAAALAEAGTRPAPLGADASRRLLESFGVPLAGEGLAHSAAEAGPLATAIGFPVVMKIASPDFPHKSDAGLVRLDVATGGRGRGRLRRARGAGHRRPSARPASKASRSSSRSRGAPR